MGTVLHDLADKNSYVVVHDLAGKIYVP